MRRLAAGRQLSFNHGAPVKKLLAAINAYWGWLAAATLFGLIICAWLSTFTYITETFPEDKCGIIGDLFGSINALFSGLAFAGVVVRSGFSKRSPRCSSRR